MKTSLFSAHIFSLSQPTIEKQNTWPKVECIFSSFVQDIWIPEQITFHFRPIVFKLQRICINKWKNRVTYAQLFNKLKPWLILIECSRIYWGLSFVSYSHLIWKPISISTMQCSYHNGHKISLSLFYFRVLFERYSSFPSLLDIKRKVL